MNLRDFQRKYGADIKFYYKNQPFPEAGEVPEDFFHLYDIVENHKQEMIRWFDMGHAEQDNPMSCVTQEHWYSMYLEKIRLEKRRLCTHHHTYKLNRAGNPPYSIFMDDYHDGKYMVNEVRQRVMCDIRYIRDNRMIGQILKDYGFRYYILRSRNNRGLYICPNCGAEMPLEKLLDGCDHCKSKFDVSAYHDKVMSVNKVLKVNDERHGESSIGFWVAMVFLSFLLSGAPFILVEILWPLLFITTWIPFIVLGLAIYRLKVVREGVNLSKQCERELLQMNPGMSLEEFLASMDCKIKAIHFADRPEDVSAFVKCNIAPYLKANRDIISCDIGKYKIRAFNMDNQYQYVDVMRSVRVIRDVGNNIMEGVGTLELTLAKRRNTKFKNDVTMYTCKHCGSTISLLEGGVCKYCGNKMDYEAYDWVIIGYRIEEAESNW